MFLMAYGIGYTMGYAIMVKTDIEIDTNRIGYHRISKGSAILWAKKRYQNIVWDARELVSQLLYSSNGLLFHQQ